MENYVLKPKDYMMLRITNAYIKPNIYRDGRLVARFRNFSGAPTHFNTKGGDRSFLIDLNRKGNAERPFLIEFGNNDPMIGWRPVTIEEVIAMGWKVDIFDAREKYPEREYSPDYVPNADLKVVVKEHEPQYASWNPKVFQHMDGREEPFSLVFHPNPMNQNELPIETLDDMWIDQAQICLTHTDKNVAYLNFMHVYPQNRTLRSPNYGDWSR